MANSNWDLLIEELREAKSKQDRARTTIAGNAKKLTDSRRLSKSTVPFESIERDIAEIRRNNAGVRLDQQRADTGQILIKAMTSFRAGKITSAQVVQIEARVLRLDTNFGIMQKSLKEFDRISDQIKSVRAQGRELAKQAADHTSQRLASIISALAGMEQSLDLTAAEAEKLREFAS